MTRFFRQATDNQFNGSVAYLDSQRTLFRADRSSGLVEIGASPGDLLVLLYAAGDEVEAYKLGPAAIAKIPLTKITVGWAKKGTSIRTVNLPSQASRAVWLALEFQPRPSQPVTSLGEWEKLLKTCRNERLTGLVEVASDLCDGFLLLHEGALVEAETIFSSSYGFQTNLQVAQNYSENPWQTTIYTASPASEAYRCMLLRLGVTRWASKILTGYQDLAGQKLLQFLNANLNALITPHQWEMRLASNQLIDNHFFTSCETASQAYRKLLQDATLLIARVIGDMLTHRTLAETFDELGTDEQRILETHKLIPADFLQ